MKKDIHPDNYRMVVFQDVSNGYSFLTRSCTETTETVKYEDGNEYPLVKMEISNTSHPFYTGKMQLIDTAGRVDKFRNRYGKHLKNQPAADESTDVQPEAAQEELAAQVEEPVVEANESTDETVDTAEQQQETQEEVVEETAEANEEEKEVQEEAAEEAAGEESTNEESAEEGSDERADDEAAPEEENKEE